jgi:hypothetical protein
MYLALVADPSTFTKPSANATLLRDATSVSTSSCLTGLKVRFFSWVEFVALASIGAAAAAAAYGKLEADFSILAFDRGTQKNRKVVDADASINVYMNENASGLVAGLIGVAITATHGGVLGSSLLVRVPFFVAVA